VAGETLGIIVADRFAFPEFRDRYLNLALSVASVCGLAVDNARTYRRIKETEEALRRSEYSLRMAQALAHLGHWEWDMHAGEMKWSEETYRILGYEPQALEPSHDAFIQVIHPDDRARVSDFISQAAHEKGGFDIEYRIVLPDGRVRVVHGLGEILVGSNEHPKMVGTIRDVTENEPVEILGVIQDITDRKELETRLAQEAQTDSLTGCANRRYFLKQAAQELARVRRYGGELSAFMLDLDHFKSINDRYGHQAGDRVLQNLVQVCRATLREEDAIGRLGGEEFAVLLPETGRERALEVAERLCQAVVASSVPMEQKPPLHFTASIGVATLAIEDSNIDMLLDRADRALYEAKSAGRNRVVVA
jgi:diguanylate cyclase (GGDEF)-like protein/PAS domain S-box-containing protein